MAHHVIEMAYGADEDFDFLVEGATYLIQGYRDKNDYWKDDYIMAVYRNGDFWIDEHIAVYEDELHLIGVSMMPFRFNEVTLAGFAERGKWGTMDY